MKSFEVQYAINTVDGKTVTVKIKATKFVIGESFVTFNDDGNKVVLAVPLNREPVIMAVEAA